MKIKSYFSSTIEGAMAQAREELGPDAMLMNTRRSMPEAAHLGAFEAVFASLPPVSPEERSKTPVPDGERLSEEIAELRRQLQQMSSRFQRSNLVSVSNLLTNPELADIFSSLVADDVDPRFAQQLIGALRARTDLSSQDIVHSALREEAASLFHVDTTFTRPSSARKVLALVGPSGAGKTTMLAKLAVKFGLTAKRSMQILTTDVNRIAASDQLQTYAAIFGTGFQVIETPRGLRQALEEHRSKSLILIDTPGYAPSEMCEAEEFARTIAATPEIETHIVLPATMKSSDVARASSRFSIFNPTSLAFTRMDETETYGTLLNEACRTGKPISFLSIGPTVPDDLRCPTRHELVDLILGDGVVAALAVA